jgi:hypothetical protein
LVAALGIAALLCSILVIAYALFRGGKVERLGAGVCGGFMLLTWVAQISLDAPLYSFLMIDTAMAGAFGVLAVRNPEKLWPGVAGVGQTVVVVFSATRALSFPMSEVAYLVALNLSGLVVAGALGAGTWAARREHRRTLSLAPAAG